jgi:hypothetical protein
MPDVPTTTSESEITLRECSLSKIRSPLSSQNFPNMKSVPVPNSHVAITFP